MTEPWIIEEEKKRKKQPEERPQLPLPLPLPPAKKKETPCTCGACGGDPAVKSHFYTFVSQKVTPIEGKPGYFRTDSYSTLARSPEHAERMCKRRFGGHKLFCWFLSTPNEPNWTCNLCGGPFHIALGHIDIKRGELWCGACTKDMIKFLKSMLVRKWGGVKFYEHATVPLKKE